jgi:hypothetical protein
VIHKNSAVFLLLLGTWFFTGMAAAQSGQPADFELQSVDSTMSADEYRQACHRNQHRIRKFLETYSEDTLLSWGVPKTGIHVLGAIAGAAVNQEGTLYLNSAKSLAIDLQDAAQNDRAIFFAIKHKW